jgi:hypothetical protein
MRVRPGTAPPLFEVASETEPGKWHQVYANGTVIKCTCKGYLSHKACPHVDAVRQHVQQTAGEVKLAEARETPPLGPGALARWIKTIHGKEFIQYAGLLALAHEQGLQELAAEFISVTPELALAAAHAFLRDGRRFWDAGDATPTNVHQQVRAHFPRVALTRAKARCLRDALNIGLVAVEELEE